MSIRKPKPQIINAHGAQVLQALQNSAHPLTLAELNAQVDMGRSLFTLAQIDLRERSLASATKAVRAPGDKTPPSMKVSITSEGKRALKHYYARTQELAAREVTVRPDTSSLFARPVYVPKPCAYVRNNGTAHIASRGVRC